MTRRTTHEPTTRICLTLVASALALSMLAAHAPVLAEDVPFVVIEDPGALASPITDADQLYRAVSEVIGAYEETGSPLPEVLSVWTAFPMGGDDIQTLFYPIANDVRGVGLEPVYEAAGVPGGVFSSSRPPLRAVLLHNDFTALEARAAHHDAPVEGYGRYLFLLELSHVWGPAARIPEPNPGALIGFDFHWSFFMDAGGSPAGGNAWIDNGDGTFTTAPAQPSTLRYSMLDLYLMGLADASEVPPFGLLEGAIVPRGARDPLNGGAVRGVTFPWLSTEPLTVRATRRALTVDDVIAANGARLPAYGESPTRFTLGIVLVVPSGADDAVIAARAAELAPLARAFAPAFHEATGERGTLEVVTSTTFGDSAPGDAGVDADGGRAVDAGVVPAPPPTDHDGGCRVSPKGAGTRLPLALALFVGVLAAQRIRSRARSTLAR